MKRTINKCHGRNWKNQCVYSGHIDPPFRLIDPLAGGNIPEGQPKNGLQ